MTSSKYIEDIGAIVILQVIFHHTLEGRRSFTKAKGDDIKLI